MCCFSRTFAPSHAKARYATIPASIRHSFQRNPGMEPTLRPLTLGEILDRTAQLYRTHFLLFAGIASVYAGILLVLSLLQIGAQEILRVLHMNQQLIWVTVIGILVLWLAIFTFGGIAVATKSTSQNASSASKPSNAAYTNIARRVCGNNLRTTSW